MKELAFDVGGTFVDLVIRDIPTGTWETYKFPITGTIDQAVLGAVDEALTNGDVLAGDVVHVAHGSTVATNILIEGTGAKVGLITTRGFRDVLEIGRQDRPSIYDSRVPRPPPLVLRDLIVEVDERMRADGSVEKALDERSVARALRYLGKRGVTAVAVCLLNAWANPAHEEAVGRRVRATISRAHVVLSSVVAPQYREYERTSTTVIAAYIAPALESYLRKLQLSLRRRGITPPLWVMQSSGGLATTPEILMHPPTAQFSGPAAGVLGALSVSKGVGEQDVVTLDVGGTSTDVSLILSGQPEVRAERNVGAWPVLDTSVAVHSIGAGGGSVAWVDAGGLLKVGPASVGARPGPACFGRGGTLATVTDAHLVLGYFGEKRLLARHLTLRRELAEAAIGRLADQLSMTIEDAAAGILQVATANIVRAVRRVTVERGHDPRDLSLVAYGGGGPLYASVLLDALGMRRGLIPSGAGVLCAFGLLTAPPRVDLMRTHVVSLDAAAVPSLVRLFRGLRTRALSRLVRQGCLPAQVRLEHRLALRYVGQAHQLSLDISSGEEDPAPRILPSIERFHARHHEEFGVSAPNARVEAVAAHVVAWAPRGDIRPIVVPHRTAAGPAERDWKSPVGQVRARVLERGSLSPGDRVCGPALVDGDDSTLALLPGHIATVLAEGTIELSVAGNP